MANNHMSEDFMLKFANEMLNQHPEVLQNNPNAQRLAKIIQSGDRQQGQQMANKLCNNYGVSPEEAAKNASQYFHL